MEVEDEFCRVRWAMRVHHAEFEYTLRVFMARRWAAFLSVKLRLLMSRM